jgi:hypothetical protein
VESGSLENRNANEVYMRRRLARRYRGERAGKKDSVEDATLDCVEK